MNTASLATENDGARWLRSHQKTVSPFGEKIADLVDWWAYGIYHLGLACLRADWSDEFAVTLVVPSGRMSTYDGSDLTRLVVAAHDRAVRIEIQGAAPRYLRIWFTARERAGDHYHRHPTLEEHIAVIREARR